LKFGKKGFDFYLVQAFKDRQSSSSGKQKNLKHLEKLKNLKNKIKSVWTNLKVSRTIVRPRKYFQTLLPFNIRQKRI